jgi:hypothetical protein
MSTLITPSRDSEVIQSKRVAARILAASGMTAREASRVMGISVSQFWNHLSHTQRSPSLWTQEGRDAVQRFTAGGEMPSEVDIAELYFAFAGDEFSETPASGPLPSDPTPEDIERECQQIQAGWSESTRVSRCSSASIGRLAHKIARRR